MEYHLSQLEDYRTFFQECSNNGIITVTQPLQMIIHDYLNNEVPRQLELARTRATSSLVKRVELLLEEVGVEIYFSVLSKRIYEA